MSKILLLSLCLFLATVGAGKCADTDVPQVGVTYNVLFAADYRGMHSMQDGDKYVIKIDAISKTNPNWVQIEFPADANSSYTSSLSGKRWINLTYVMELRVYTPPPQ